MSQVRAVLRAHDRLERRRAHLEIQSIKTAVAASLSKKNEPASREYENALLED